MSVETTLFVLILLAGFYTAWNIGANDVANAMGTSVGAGALTLRNAVILAAILEFVGAFFFGAHVSDTIQGGIIDASIFSKHPLTLVYGMLAVLVGTGIWLQIASYFGWPVSTTHSIVGGMVGFGAAVGGMEAIQWDNIVFIVASWLVSPLLGGVVSFLIFSILRKQIFYTSKPVANAKKLTPFLVFIFIIILSVMVIFGLHSIEFSFLKSSLICLVTASLGAILSYFLVRNIAEPPRTKTSSNFNPEVVIQLQKAKKHLESAQASLEGATGYQMSIIMDEIDGLKSSYKVQEDTSNTHAEYAIVEKIFGYLQIITACAMAFAHGANDVANAIGPLTAAIHVLASGEVQSSTVVPVWALALGGVGIVVGLATWGWRVIETIGKKITELTPTRGFAAEFGAAATVVLASRLGLPISTTHTLVGSVVGVGLARGIEALDLRTTRDILVSWVATIPIGASVTIGLFYAIQAIFNS